MLTPKTKSPATVLRFLATGGVATVVHMAVGTTLIAMGTAPLLANVGAFLCAFLVSFFGHFHFSFRGHGMALSRSLVRFIVTAALGFAVNEGTLGLLLWLTAVPPTVALVLSTGFAAVLTYTLSRNWAFKSQTKSAG